MIYRVRFLLLLFFLAAEIERELIRQRTKEALAKRKAEGKKLGRPKGSYSSKEMRTQVKTYTK